MCLTKKQSTVLVFEREPNPTKVVCGKISSKQMVACFFCKTGYVATVPLEHRRTINSEWYTTICLPKIIGLIRKTNKRRRIIVHHGNASYHTSAQVSVLLTGHNVELMGQPPYNPDLASNDFSLFLHIKKKMRGQRFSSREDTSKTMLWRCLHRSGKTNTNDASGNTRNMPGQKVYINIIANPYIVLIINVNSYDIGICIHYHSAHCGVRRE